VTLSVLCKHIKEVMQRLYLSSDIDHCLEAIRISLMCKADISVYTFRWDESVDTHRPLPKSNAEHKCVDWNALELWAHSRKTDLAPKLVRENGEAEVIHM
jgi:hypothetical protein